MRVLVVDDYKPFWGVVRKALGRGFQVVGEAADGEEAVRLARALRPDLVLMDVALPGINGFQATQQILEICPQAKVVLLSMYQEDEYARLAKEVGAVGFIPKGDFRAETLRGLLARATEG